MTFEMTYDKGKDPPADGGHHRISVRNSKLAHRGTGSGGPTGIEHACYFDKEHNPTTGLKSEMESEAPTSF